MRTKGSKNLSTAESTQLKRETAFEVNSYKQRTLTESQIDLINQFNKESFDIYFTYYKKWGLQNNSRTKLVDDLIANDLNGPALDLANLRLIDNYAAQKVWACIKYRWTDNETVKIKKFNQDPNKFWYKMAKQIQTRSEDDHRQLESEWEGDAGRLLLVEYLKDLFNQQNGLCAVSKQSMLLEIMSDRTNKNLRLSDKCSPDRIDSNKGYVKGNIQLTTWWVNHWKSNLTLDEFYNKIDLIQKNKQ